MEAVQRRAVGTVTNSQENNTTCGPVDKLKKCTLQNIIQHIDIYGRHRASCVFNEKNRSTIAIPQSYTSVSSATSKFANNYNMTDKEVESKLRKFSVKTKVSGLWPGNDILSKKTKKKVFSRNNGSVVFATVIPQ